MGLSREEKEHIKNERDKGAVDRELRRRQRIGEKLKIAEAMQRREIRREFRRRGLQVYFLQEKNDPGGPIKIGYAFDVNHRVATLQVGNWRPLHLLGSIEKPEHECFRLESELHKKFEADKVLGEWFRCSPELLDYIAKNKDTFNPYGPKDKDIWGERR